MDCMYRTRGIVAAIILAAIVISGALILNHQSAEIGSLQSRVRTAELQASLAARAARDAQGESDSLQRTFQCLHPSPPLRNDC